RPLSPPAPMVLLGRPSGRVGPCRKTFSVARGCLNLAQRRSPVAQWQSTRLLTEGLLVRVQPGEPTQKPAAFASGFLRFCPGGRRAFPSQEAVAARCGANRDRRAAPRPPYGSGGGSLAGKLCSTMSS